MLAHRRSDGYTFCDDERNRIDCDGYWARLCVGHGIQEGFWVRAVRPIGRHDEGKSGVRQFVPCRGVKRAFRWLLVAGRAQTTARPGQQTQENFMLPEEFCLEKQQLKMKLARGERVLIKRGDAVGISMEFPGTCFGLSPGPRAKPWTIEPPFTRRLHEARVAVHALLPRKRFGLTICRPLQRSMNRIVKLAPLL